jgi:hypothetical protein
MRKLVLCFAFPVSTMLSLPALAQDGDSGSERGRPVIRTPLVPADDDDGEGYGDAVNNRLQIGLNSVITFPADPVMSTYQPDEEWNDLPFSVVTKYPVGFFQGTLLMLHRATAGTFDLLMAPVTPMRMVSPEPRFLLFPNAEHEEY